MINVYVHIILVKILKMYEHNNLCSGPDYNYEWNSIVGRLNKILWGRD